MKGSNVKKEEPQHKPLPHMITTKVIDDNVDENINLDQYKDSNVLLELCTKPSNLSIIHLLITKKFFLDTVLNIRGRKETINMQVIERLEKNQKPNKISYIIDTTHWNPLNFAILYDQVLYVKYFLEQNQEPSIFAYINPTQAQSTNQIVQKSEKSSVIDEIILPLVCVSKKQTLTLNYLVNEQYSYWTYSRLHLLFINCVAASWKEGILTILQGSTLKSNFESRTTIGKLKLIEDYFEMLLDLSVASKANQVIKLIEQMMLRQPYVGVTFYKLVKGEYSQYFQVSAETLKQITSILTPTDIFTFCSELELDNAQFLKELGSCSNSYTKSVYQQFESVIKQALLKPPFDYHEDFILLCRNGKDQEIKNFITKYKIESIYHIKGWKSEIELLKNDKYAMVLDTTKCNPLLICLLSQNIGTFSLLINQSHSNLHKSLLFDPDNDEGEESIAQHNEMLPFQIAIHHQNILMLNLLLSPQVNTLWNLSHLKQVFEVMRAENWQEGYIALLESHFLKVMFKGFHCLYDHKLEMLQVMHISFSESKERDVFQGRVNSICSSQPYALVNLLMLLNMYDFFQKKVQKELGLLVSQCVDNTKVEEIQEWLMEEGKQAVSFVVVKEFMVRALDTNIPAQKLLKMKLLQFFQQVRTVPQFTKLEEEADIMNSAPSVKENSIHSQIKILQSTLL